MVSGYVGMVFDQATVCRRVREWEERVGRESRLDQGRALIAT